ncbi:hypothetical protein D3C80_1446280 [compost metagenome]
MKVNEFDLNNKPGKKHQFIYKGIDQLPSRLTFDQDYDGYYNGKNNTYLVPKPTSAAMRMLFDRAGGNREPDGRFSVMGMMEKVIYPTGGYNEFFYEPNDVYVTEREDPVFVNESLMLDGTDESYYLHEWVSTNKTITLGTDQTIDFNCEFVNSNSFTDEDTHIQMWFEIRNLTDGVSVYSKGFLPNESKKFSVDLFANKTYKISLELMGYNGYYGDLSFTYDASSGQMVNKNKEFS